MSEHTEPTAVLFVCLGNICRSPLAEGVFIALLEEDGLSPHFVVDSAGTGAYHTGERADPRSIAVAEKNGVHLPSVARQVTSEDMHRFDVIVAMDRSNLRSLERLRTGGDRAQLVMMRDYDPDDPGGDVPDPYYGGAGGFDEVYDMVERACRGLLSSLR